jgi:hypothetical protein
VARQQTSEALWPALLDDVQNALIRLRADLTRGDAQTRARTAKNSTESE